MSQELYIQFDDYVVIEAMHQLEQEGHKVSTRNVRDRFNLILKQNPQLTYCTQEISSHTSIAQSFLRLTDAGLITTRLDGEAIINNVRARIVPERFVEFYEDMQARYGKNLLNWPFKLPKGPNGPDFDGATFIHITKE